MGLTFYDDKGCRPTVKITDDGKMSTYEKLCYVWQKMEEVIGFVNDLESDISKKEDSTFITNNRKLSADGDFTGTLCKLKSACQVVAELNSNRNMLNYIAAQFSDGQTGYVIDGGFFDDSGIRKSYSGGYF